MKTVLAIALPGGAIVTAILWWLGEHLSSDAIGMAIGMALGTLAGLPVAALVILAARRDREDDCDDDWQQRSPAAPAQPLIIIVQPQPQALQQPQARIVDYDPAGPQYLATAPQQRRQLAEWDRYPAVGGGL